MSQRVLAVVVRGWASTEQVTRKESVTTFMDFGMCKRRPLEVDVHLELAFLLCAPTSWLLLHGT